MQKSIHFKQKLYAILISMLVTGTAIAGQTPAKKIIYVDFNTQTDKAHAEMQALKNMDVLGVNLKQHWAEVYVTNSELAQLQAKKLHIRKANHRLRQASAAKDLYLNPTLIRQALTDIHTKYPTITNLFEVGKTHRKRPIMGLEISATPGDSNKPVVLFNGMHHAREVMTPEVVMHIANVLTEKYGNDAEVTSWLNNYRIVLVPQVNPDGNAIVNSNDPMWRKNAYQLQSRTVGVDLNRNYPAYWNYCGGSEGRPESEIYRGPSAGSEPETKAMMNLIETLKPVADISYHSYSELILYPFGCASVSNPAKDLFQSIGEDMNKYIRNDQNETNEYKVGPTATTIYEADGSDLDWQWKEHGVLAYCIEVNADDFHPDYKEWRNITVERQEGGWQTLLRRMSQSGFRAHIQTSTPNELRYSLKKIEGSRRLAFDGDAPNRTFALRSSTGLMYQLTEKGKYEVTFYQNNKPVKSLKVDVGDALVDLGNIEI